MTDKQKEICEMLLESTKSLEEKKDELWYLPDEELIFLLGQFKPDEHHEICCAIKAIMDEKKTDPDCYQFSGLE